MYVMIMKRIAGVKELWSNTITPSEQNRAYRLLVERIVYERVDDGVTLEVLYK